MKALSLILGFFLISLSAHAERVVAIGGDVCEILFALAQQHDIVGRDLTCTMPKEVQKIPNVGYMRQLNAEGILSLNPSLIITTENAKPASVFNQLHSSGVRVIVVPATPAPETIIKKIRLIANTLDVKDSGEELIATIQHKLSSLDTSPLPVKILMLMGYTSHTPMVAGRDTIPDKIIQLAGGINAMNTISRYQPISAEGVINADPDLILISQMGLEMLGGTEKLWQLPGIMMTPAGKNRRLVVIEDSALLNFGPSMPDGLQQLRMSMLE